MALMLRYANGSEGVNQGVGWSDGHHNKFDLMFDRSCLIRNKICVNLINTNFKVAHES